MAPHLSKKVGNADVLHVTLGNNVPRPIYVIKSTKKRGDGLSRYLLTNLPECADGKVDDAVLAALLEAVHAEKGKCEESVMPAAESVNPLLPTASRATLGVLAAVQAPAEGKKDHILHVIKKSHKHPLSLPYSPLRTPGLIAGLIAAQASDNVDNNVVRRRAQRLVGYFKRVETAKRKNLRDSAEAGANDDGWIMVPYGAKKVSDGWGHTVSVDQTSQAELKAKKDKKDAECQVQDFYRFQLRNKRLGDVEALRLKFEADKQAVDRMREQRELNPFG
ncbi:ribosomal RNA-processing protein 7 [Kipferlia bialata]|uniref:Ribosomal RNA-processing protein 7 n=1 Tax=Kipferlia bialata TaxID=797122 RepID=A0A391NPE2_9EUKA|nr:ribosomal RNA-processing protein 7 [Kipferlia bialata]|eukprot:g9743.t1